MPPVSVPQQPPCQTQHQVRPETGSARLLPLWPYLRTCSSGQRFAYSFLQIPPRDGHPCRSANTSPCRVCSGLSPPSVCALPGAHTQTPTGMTSGRFCCFRTFSAGLLNYEEARNMLLSCPFVLVIALAVNVQSGPAVGLAHEFLHHLYRLNSCCRSENWHLRPDRRKVAGPHATTRNPSRDYRTRTLPVIRVRGIPRNIE
jgi:hypothetical protein